MLIEKTLKEALADYIKGKPVTVLWTRDDGSMDVRLLSDILEQEENHFLVNVPAYHNPEFAQAVAEMVEQNRPENCSAEVAPAGTTEKDGSTTPPLTEPDSVVIPAENKREKALELAKEGKGAAEIARMIDAKYSTVYSWLNPDKCKKPKLENKTASNADRHKCKTCMFRTTGYNAKGAGCSYIEITGHSRGCSVEECSVYQKGDAVSKRKMKGFYE